MHRFKSLKGMVLLTTVLLLSLVAALVFSMQRAVWLYTKVHQTASIRYQVFEALEREALKWVEHGNVHISDDCSSEMLDVNVAMRMLKKGYGCIMVSDNKKYRYWVNILGYVDKQVVLAIWAMSHPDIILSVRFSSTQGLMSWWVV